jgi:hypothetical protein
VEQHCYTHQHITTAQYDEGTDFQARSQKWQKKWLISFVMSVRLRGTTRLPLEGFYLNLIFEYFLKLCRGYSSFIKTDKNNCCLTYSPVYIYDIDLILRVLDCIVTIFFSVYLVLWLF